MEARIWPARWRRGFPLQGIQDVNDDIDKYQKVFSRTNRVLETLIHSRVTRNRPDKGCGSRQPTPTRRRHTQVMRSHFGLLVCPSRFSFSTDHFGQEL